MKTIILTNNNSFYGKNLIKMVIAAGIAIDTIVVIKQPLSYYFKLFYYVRKRVGFFDALHFSFSLIFKNSSNSELRKIKYSQFNVSVIYTNGTNSRKTENILKNIEPDIIILAQTGIIRKNILTIPKIGILNAHPAVLPYYRGIDCCKWAIFQNDYDKIGATLHWVDAGIDTGNIIETRKYNIKNTRNISDLENKLNDLCINVLIDNLINFDKKTSPKEEKQNIGEGRQYYKMPYKKEKITIKTYNNYMKNK